MTLADLPVLNAILNACSAIFLGFGYAFILRGKKDSHRNCMIAALITSSLFLISYLIYHAGMQRTYGVAHTSFQNPVWFRPVYLTILITHLVAAIAIVPMVILTVLRAAKRDFENHARLARWTLPAWMYVSISGVMIYLILYQIFPQR